MLADILILDGYCVSKAHNYNINSLSPFDCSSTEGTEMKVKIHIDLRWK